MMQKSRARSGQPNLPDQPAYRLSGNVLAARALAPVAIIAVTAWSSSLNRALAADNSAWLGRWSIAAETCQNDGYDMLIEPDHFEIWEQGCDIKKWSINGNLATLTMQCFNEGNSVTQERVQLLLRGDTIEVKPGSNFTPRTMVRCR
jgi:hypothetical protein